MLVKQLQSKTILSRATAHDGGAQAGWKMNTEGTAVEIKTGHPVYIGTDGKEMIVKGTTLTELRGEAMGHRTAKEQAELRLKDFDGIDPKVARESIELAKKIDQKTLIDAGKVDELKNQITSQFQTQIAEKDTALTAAQQELHNLKIDNIFAGSEFVRNDIAVPRDMFEATFRGNFKVAEGKVVAYDKAGNRLLSKKIAGEYATPEEALEILVDAHPQKEHILKADVGKGSGNGGGGGNSGLSRTMRRSEYDAKTPAEQAALAGKVGKGEIKIVD